jgi:hypothetical protein
VRILLAFMFNERCLAAVFCHKDVSGCPFESFGAGHEHHEDEDSGRHELPSTVGGYTSAEPIVILDDGAAVKLVDFIPKIEAFWQARFP